MFSFDELLLGGLAYFLIVSNFPHLYCFAGWNKLLKTCGKCSLLCVIIFVIFASPLCMMGDYYELPSSYNKDK